MLNEDLLAGAKAAAAYVGVPVRTIYALTENNRLPVIRLGTRRLYYRKSELEAAFRSEVA